MYSPCSAKFRFMCVMCKYFCSLLPALVNKDECVSGVITNSTEANSENKMLGNDLSNRYMYVKRQHVFSGSFYITAIL